MPKAGVLLSRPAGVIALVLCVICQKRSSLAGHFWIRGPAKMCPLDVLRRHDKQDGILSRPDCACDWM